MKIKLVGLIGFLAITQISFGQAKEYNSSLERVKIYANGAEVHRTAKVNLKQGTQTVIVKGLSTNVDRNSIIMGVSNGATVLSTNVGRSNGFNEVKNHPKVQKVIDSIVIYNKKRVKFDNRRAVLNSEKNLLQQNSKLGGDNGVNIDDLEKAAAFFNKRYSFLYDALSDLEEKNQAVRMNIRRLNNQLTQLRQEYPSEPRGRFEIQISSSKSTTAQLSFSYLTRNARWVSIYEARSNGMGEDVKLIHKASVMQNTGENWSNVKLELSTGNPNVGVSIPNLYPKYLSFAPTYKANYSNRAAPKRMKTQYLDSRSDDRPEMELEETNETFSGNGSGAGRSGVSAFTRQTATDVAVEYVVDKLYTMPSSRQAQLVSLKEYTVNANYTYYTVPKMGASVYLVAKLTGWQQYNLLAGQVNLFFKGSYVGKTNFNPRASSDTLSLSLGKDAKVIVQRKNQRDFTKVKTIGSNQKETLGYTISINNTYNKDISIEVVDQVPLSKHSDIVVEVTESSKAQKNMKTGELTWELNIKAGKTKSVEVTYEVTSPKNKTVYGL